MLTAAFWNENVRDNSDYLKAEVDAIGMVLINTTPVTAAASVSVNNVFSSDYQTYLIIVRLSTASALAALDMRLRVGGVDNSTASSYTRERLLQTGATVQGGTEVQSQWASIGGLLGVSQRTLTTITISSPAEAARTHFLCHTARDDAQAVQSGFHNQSTAYDGFSLIAVSGTITGNVRTYGYVGAP